MVSSDSHGRGLGESERRQATILFADISGFTSMSEKVDAEIVTSTMNDCFRMLGSVVERNGGVIDKFIGDCVMVLFGVPRAVEDSATRAVQTALEMLGCIQEARRERSVAAELDIHIGINTGEVIAGEVGSEQKREYTVMGDAVNLASRLKDAAPKGRIYVGPQTWRLTKEGYQYQNPHLIALKGKENPVAAHELVGRSSGMAQGRMVFSPLVGRQKELDLLELQVLKAINGDGSIVHVVGEAGLGKSRLMAELRNQECMRRVTLLEGRAQSFGKNLSYHPVIDLLRKWAGIREEEGEEEAFRKLERGIRSVSPEGVEEALPFMATLMGMKLTGKHAQRMEGIVGDTLAKLIYKTARAVLSGGSARRPLVIVLEDMHWADESTVEFVEYLFRMVERDRVLFLNVFRPREERGERLSKAAREGYGGRFLEVVLQPLDGEGSRELVQNLLRSGGVPPSIMESIGSRAGGNPFFIEEIMRACIDEKAVEVGKDGFRVTERIRSFVVPSTVNEVVMARFDRLDKETRELLRTASVIGRSFFYSILVQITQGVEDIDGKIGSLKEMQIILERSRAEEVEYLFKHALAQEAIYDSILLQVRKNLHLSVARAIESIFAERLGEFAGMLAWHYTRAGDYDKAEEYMIRAGEEALKSAASSEAIAYYREALELYLWKQGENADPAKVVMLEKNIARSLYYKGRYAEAVPYYDRARGFYGVVVPEGRVATVMAAALGFAKCMRWLYSPERRRLKPLTPELREGFLLTLEKMRMLIVIDTLSFAAESFIALRQILSYDVGDFEAGLICRTGISTLFAYSGISRPLSRRVLDKVGRAISPKLPGAWNFYLLARMLHCYIAGEWEECGSIRGSMVETPLEQGELYDSIRIQWFSCLVAVERGDWEQFHDARRVVEEVSERFDHDDGRWIASYATLRYLVKRRMVGEASDIVPRLMKLVSGGAFLDSAASHVLAFSARVAVLRGDLERAIVEIHRSLKPDWRSWGNVNEDGFSCGAAAAVGMERVYRAAAHGKLDRATRGEGLAALRRYLRNARKFAPDLTEALKLLGRYCWCTGSRRRAVAYWRQSIREGERLGGKVELAHTLVDAGKLLADMEPGPEWRKRGAELYAELGIQGV